MAKPKSSLTMHAWVEEQQLCPHCGGKLPGKLIRKKRLGDDDKQNVAPHISRRKGRK